MQYVLCKLSTLAKYLDIMGWCSALVKAAQSDDANFMQVVFL